MSEGPQLETADRIAVMAIQLYMLITLLDVLLAWVQPDPQRIPRRLTHVLTEPLQRPLRAILRHLPPRDWDLSPIVVVLALGIVRVWLVRP